MRDRIRKLNEQPFRTDAEYVLYWSQMNRRATFNHALDFAIELANEHGLPVLFYEGLTCTYRHANDRLHTFILEGVPDTQRVLDDAGVGYVFYLRRTTKDRNDLVYLLAERAAAVVTDDYPVFVAARHNERVPLKMDVAYFAVDSSCIVPMNKHLKREYAAYTIRPKIAKLLPEYLCRPDIPKPRRVWAEVRSEFHVEVTRQNIGELTASCEIDHSVPVVSDHGGNAAAEERLSHFLEVNLRQYARLRNEPSAHATSNLSPFLHFGHISSLEVALRVREYAQRHHLIADEFLEELVVRRELAFNFARFATNPKSFDDLPNWAIATMNKHASDKRSPSFTRAEMEEARTYDPLWNATQTELLLRGKIHGYYRMYWGKKIIEWSNTYEDALDLMIYLHDRYAIDGRDPNTYTNILWCFGLHDRPWFERPIFGTLRFMSLEGMKRKTEVEAYIKEISAMEASSKLSARLKA